MARVQPFDCAGERIEPGQRRAVRLPVARLYTDTQMELHVEVLHGKKPGPVLLICAAIHGDELNGIEICRRLLVKLNPAQLAGTVMIVPIVNVFGFIQQSRYLPDRRDLNRCFPGSSQGALASRLAALFTEQLVAKATHVIDLHTGAIHRNNLAQVRCDTSVPELLALAHAFNAPVTMHSSARDGSLRGFCQAQGKPCILYEAGEALRFNELFIRTGVRGVQSVKGHLQMIPPKTSSRHFPDTVLAKRSVWVRANADGLVRTLVKLGDKVSKQQPVAQIVSPHGAVPTELLAQHAGIVVGLSHIPVAHEGEALIHLAQFHADDMDYVNEQIDEYLIDFAE